MRPNFRCRAALAGAALAVAATAQPAPRLSSLSIEWIQRGKSANVSAKGENLGGARQVLVSGAPGVTASLVPPEAGPIGIESSAGGVTAIGPADGKTLEFELAARTNAALEECEIRIATDGGVSNPVTVRVGHLPEVRSNGRTSAKEAQKVELPAAIGGVLQNAAETHYFSFEAKKGQHVILEVYAARDGSKLDSSLAVLDGNGKELARDEDGAGLDSVVDFAAPEDGTYVAALRDFRYQGAGDYSYRLLAGTTPYVASVFPFGGQRGKTVELALEGVNLGEAGQLRLAVDEAATVERTQLRATTPSGLSNPFPFEISDLPGQSEAEPNSALDQADAMPIPVAIDGRIGARKDYDAFRFEPTAGQRVVFEAQAFQFGSHLDATLTLTDADGTVLQRNDDANAVDARIDYTFKNGGTHYLILEDLLGRGGKDFPYRLTAASPQPSFSVSVLPDTPRLRRGDRFPLRIELARMNGFAGPVKIVCENLPGGVFAEPLVIAPNGPAAGVLMLTATGDAATGSFPLHISGVAKNGKRAARAYSGDRAVKQAYLTVLDAAPFAISAAGLLAAFEQNEAGNIEVVAERRDGFNGEIKVSAEAFSAARDSMTRSFDYQPLTLKVGETGGTLVLRAKNDAETGPRPLVLKAEGSADGVTYTAYSRPLPASLSEIPFTIVPSLKKLLVTALPESSGSAASEAAFAVKASRRMNFTGEIELTIEGVPEGVKTTIANIAENAGEAAVKLVATEKAAAGKDFPITIGGKGTHGDRVYRFKSSPVVLTINAPEKEEAKIAAQQP